MNRYEKQSVFDAYFARWASTRKSQDPLIQSLVQELDQEIKKLEKNDGTTVQSLPEGDRRGKGPGGAGKKDL